MFNIQRTSDAEVKEILTALPQEVIDWGHGVVNMQRAWEKRLTGKGVVVGQADTGVDYNHNDLAPNILKAKSFVDSTSGIDSGYHGTHVAGIMTGCNNGFGVVGGSPDAKLLSAKVFRQDGSFGGEYDALYWLASEGAKVINMSYGGYFPTDIPEAAQQVKEYEKFLQELVDSGVTLVAAAGNSGNARDKYDRVAWPARFDCVIAVGAISPELKRADFSSVGPAVDFGMPGTDIYSTYPGNRYARYSGTSMASPLTVSCIANLQQWALENLGRLLSPSEVREYLKSFAVDLGFEGFDVEHGYGVINIGKVGTKLLKETRIILAAPPTIINGRTLAPLRAVVELGGGIFESFDSETKVIKFVTGDGRKVTMQVDNPEMLIQS